MIIEKDEQYLIMLLEKQLSNFFVLSNEEIEILHEQLDRVISKVAYNFSYHTNKYYQKNIDGQTIAYFNPYHSAQYCIYLYYFSHTLSKLNKNLADKVYYLNKIMNGCDLYHEIILPNIFSLDHSVGSVMGRATYGDYFHFAQNCTVGNNRGVYPIIGKGVSMSANSAILGNCFIGDYVTLGAGCIIKDDDIPSHSLVFGQSPNLIIKIREGN